MLLGGSFANLQISIIRFLYCRLGRTSHFQRTSIRIILSNAHPAHKLLNYLTLISLSARGHFVVYTDLYEKGPSVGVSTGVLVGFNDKMKFGQHLLSHLTPEWRKQYVDYEVSLIYTPQDWLKNGSIGAEKDVVQYGRKRFSSYGR